MAELGEEAPGGNPNYGKLAGTGHRRPLLFGSGDAIGAIKNRPRSRSPEDVQ